MAEQPAPSPHEMSLHARPDLLTHPGQFRFLVDTLAKQEPIPPPLQRIHQLKQELRSWKKEDQIRGQGKFLGFFTNMDQKQNMEMFSLFQTMMNSTDHFAEIAKMGATNTPAAEAIASGLQYAVIATKLEQSGKAAEIVSLPYADPVLKKLLRYHAVTLPADLPSWKRGVEYFAKDYALARASADPAKTDAVKRTLDAINRTPTDVQITSSNLSPDVVSGVQGAIRQLATEVAKLQKTTAPIAPVVPPAIGRIPPRIPMHQN